MKKTLTLVFLIIATVASAQKEGMVFCEGDDTEGYFPLINLNKVVVWYNTYYSESLKGEQVLNGKTYKLYEQEWKDGTKHTLYMREEGTSTLQYDEETKKEIVRFDDTYKLGHQWQGKDVRYKIRSFTEELLTPVCRYRNLMAIEAVYPKITYVFYYLKGFGYVGATKGDNLISFVIPNLEVLKELEKKLEEYKNFRTQ